MSESMLNKEEFSKWSLLTAVSALQNNIVLSTMFFVMDIFLQVQSLYMFILKLTMKGTNRIDNNRIEFNVKYMLSVVYGVD